MNSRILTVFLGVAILFAVLALRLRCSEVRLQGVDTGYQPAQPIAFSHRLHAGELQVDCLYCHTGAESGRHAGLPAMNVCMNCHRFVTASFGAVRAESTLATGEKRAPRPVVSPEILKLYRSLGLDAGGVRDPALIPAPIQWTQVYMLPDYAQFDHRAHVNAGVACQTCHGPVEDMEQMRQTGTLGMGWCVNCHRDANLNGLNGREVSAPEDCGACHY